MTIASTENKTIYGGNGSTSTFAIPFMFLSHNDIEVVLTTVDDIEFTQVQGTDYQLSGAGDQSGGFCVMSLPPEEGEVLVIRRSPAMVQEVDYVENDAFPAATHEAALDKLTMICQALAERLDRTISFRVSSAVTGVELPDPDADRFLAWNDDGTDLVNKDIAAVGTVVLPVPISQGGTGASSTTGAMINLGFGATGMALVGCETPDEFMETVAPSALYADQTGELAVGYSAQANPMVTDTPVPATGALQTIDTSGGDTTLGTPGAAGVIRFVVTGAGALNPSAAYDSIDGSYDTDVAMAQGEIVSDGTHHFLTIVNGVSAS